MYIKLTQEEFPKNLFKFHSKLMSGICILSSTGRKDLERPIVERSNFRLYLRKPT